VKHHIDVLRTKSDQDRADPGNAEKDQTPGGEAASRPDRASQEEPDQDQYAGQDECDVHQRVKR
jgi:hypothetical protein